MQIFFIYKFFFYTVKMYINIITFTPYITVRCI